MENITNKFYPSNFDVDGPMLAAMQYILKDNLQKTVIGKTYYEVFEDIVEHNLKNDKTFNNIPDEYKSYYIEAKCYQTIRNKKIGMDIIAETVICDAMNIIMKKYPYIFGDSSVEQTPKLERYDYNMLFSVNNRHLFFEGENKISQVKGAIHLGSTVKNYIENIINNPCSITRLLFRSMYENTDIKDDMITTMDVELLINSLRIKKADGKNFYIFNFYNYKKGKSGLDKAKHTISSHEVFDDSLVILIEKYCNGVYTIENIRKVYLMTMINTILYNNDMDINTADDCLKMIIDNEPEIYKEVIEYIYENDGFDNNCIIVNKSASASKKYRDSQKTLYGKKMLSFPVNSFIKVLKSGNDRDINNPADYTICKKVADNNIIILNTTKLVNNFIENNAKTNLFKDVTAEYNDMQMAV